MNEWERDSGRGGSVENRTGVPPAEIKTPLSYADALSLAFMAVPNGDVHTLARLISVLQAVDVASRAQAWADKGGPELLETLKIVAPCLHSLDDLAPKHPSGMRLGPHVDAVIARSEGR